MVLVQVRLLDGRPISSFVYLDSLSGSTIDRLKSVISETIYPPSIVSLGDLQVDDAVLDDGAPVSAVARVPPLIVKASGMMDFVTHRLALWLMPVIQWQERWMPESHNRCRQPARRVIETMLAIRSLVEGSLLWVMSIELMFEIFQHMH